MTQANNAGWLTPVAAAEILGCHPSTVREMVRRGELVARKIGSAIRIDPHSVLPTDASVPRPVREQTDLTPLLQQVDVAMQMLQIIRDQLTAASNERM